MITYLKNLYRRVSGNYDRESNNERSKSVRDELREDYGYFTLSNIVTDGQTVLRQTIRQQQNPMPNNYLVKLVHETNPDIDTCQILGLKIPPFVIVGAPERPADCDYYELYWREMDYDEIEHLISWNQDPAWSPLPTIQKVKQELQHG